jgi:hypothetical protein
MPTPVLTPLGLIEPTTPEGLLGWPPYFIKKCGIVFKGGNRDNKKKV